MLTTGIRTPIGIKVFGNDLEAIERTGLALERVMHETGPVAFEPEAPAEVEAITSEGGLSGELARAVGHYPGQPRAALQVAELADRRHVYRLTLEATTEFAGMAEQAFRALLRSVAPLPEPSAPAVDASAMSHWAD